MTFAEYLWKLLTRPYKLGQEKLLETKKWIGVLGSILDDAKQSMFQLRRNWVVGTATGPALEIHGEARRILRRPGESVEAYRHRVETAFEVYMLGGTNPGIIAGLESLGYPNAKVLEFLEGYSWAEFKVAFDLDGRSISSPVAFEAIREVIYLTKAAHTMPVGIIMESHQTIDLYRATVLRQGGSQKIDLPYPETVTPVPIYSGNIIRISGCSTIPYSTPVNIKTNIQYASIIRHGGRSIIN